MENYEFKIYATGLNKQYWCLTLVKCRNLLLVNPILLNKWSEATGDDGTNLKKLISKIECAISNINLTIEETTLAYSAINILQQYYVFDCFSKEYEDNLSKGQTYLAQWQVFAINAYEDLYFNENCPSFIDSVVRANLILGKKEVLFHLN